VQFGANDNLRYTYDAAGNKLVKVVYGTVAGNNTRLDYPGNFLYENNELKTIFTSAGRIIPFDNNGSIVYKFEYNLQDHLGNTRVVFSGHSNGQPEVMQVTDYYPFGMVMNQENYFASGVLSNKYLYNNKELQDDELAGNSLGWYDYGARFYDAELGRWHSIDPLAEKYIEWSPYNYVGANPILRIDTDGRDWDIAINHDQRTVTVSASFNTFAGNKGTLQKAADNWNAQSGKYSYVVGKGDDAISYSVNFDVSINSSESASNSVSVLPDNSKFFQERTEIDASGNEIKVEPQGVADGKNIAVKDSQKGDTNIAAHEMGHNLGMGHSSGLMQETTGGKSLSKTSVKETLGHSGVGKGVKGATTNAKMQNKTVTGTAPTNFQNGQIKKNKDWEKTNFN
jgi:RHS repeat-associated protein